MLKKSLKYQKEKLKTGTLNESKTMSNSFILRDVQVYNEPPPPKKSPSFSTTTTFPGCYQIHEIAGKQIHIVFDKGILLDF